MNQNRIVPALGWRRLTGMYDAVVALAAREGGFKRQLIGQAGIREGMAVLDLGCGTGTLALWIKRRCPDAHVTGLDADPEVLARARQKLAEADV